MKRTTILFALLFVLNVNAFSQGPYRDPSAPFDLKTELWNARWISVPGCGPQDYGVYYFRKDVNLSEVPSDYVVHVSGDNRYKLYVNGTLVSLGPAKGDATHWNYETVNLSPWLRAGDNAIAALVYHEGAQKPYSQVSVSTGFILQGEGAAAGLYTDSSWKCFRDNAFSPISPVVDGYYVAGPGERVDLGLTIEGWNSPAVSTDTWENAVRGPAGEPKDVMSSDQADGHNLMPSPLPQMELTPRRFAAVRKAEGVSVPRDFLSGGSALVIPANTQAELLLDNSVLTNAYFKLQLEGGKGADVRIGYAESLYIPDPSPRTELSRQDLARIQDEYDSAGKMPRILGKGNRDEVDGKLFIGREDVLLPDGREHEFVTLSWRTYRYVRVRISTGQQALTLKDVSGIFTGYPFTLDSSVDTDRGELRTLYETGWRTARLCAIETYMDCPYYEQLQYFGDTRIQALVTLYNSSDDRLVKNYLRLADISRNSDGITKSRYPTSVPQYIQPFALCYIYALHDYMMYGGDTQFVMDLVPGAEQILEYFHRYQQEDGRVKNLPGWNFNDWVEDSFAWSFGVPRKGEDGCSINNDLQLMYAYQLMAEMEDVRGNTWQADVYRKEAGRIGEAVKRTYWNDERGLFADRAEKDNYSQHGNVLAILCGIVDDPAALAEKLLSDKSLNQCTIYYKFYLHQALVKAGLGDHYLEWLDIWRKNMDMGMTTWAEMSDVNASRSDCHAWSASPNVEIFRTIMGIDSDAAGFRRVRIEPHLGDLKEIGGSIPHPSGTVSVHYKLSGQRLEARIDLPKGVDGTFVWKGRSVPLHEGSNSVRL